MKKEKDWVKRADIELFLWKCVLGFSILLAIGTAGVIVKLITMSTFDF